MSAPAIIFRACWPIVDETVSFATMCREAQADLPLLIAQAKAKVIRPGRFTIAPSVEVPGSGRVTESVLIYEAPAVRAPARAYHSGAAA